MTRTLMEKRHIVQELLLVWDRTDSAFLAGKIIAALEAASSVPVETTGVPRPLARGLLRDDANQRPRRARETDDPDAWEWRQAAYRLGEELAANGPNGYYQFTPAEWLQWCLQTLRETPSPVPPADGIRARILQAGYAGLCSTPEVGEHSAASYICAAREALTAAKGQLQPTLDMDHPVFSEDFLAGYRQALARIDDLLTALGEGETDGQGKMRGS